MRRDQLDAHLEQYTEEENFYRDYYRASQRPEELRRFLDEVDLEYLRRNKFVLPELRERLDHHFRDEGWVWEDPEEDVTIQKHARFMPDWNFEHSFYEIVYIYSGSAPVRIAHETLQMTAGDVCLIPPNVSHTLQVYDNSIALNIKIRKSTFNGPFFQMLTDNNVLSRFFVNTIYIGDYKDYILIPSGDDAKVREYFAEMFLEYSNRERYYQKILNHQLIILFAYLLRKYGDNLRASGSESRNEKIERILNYTIKHYQTITLSELAEHFYFTEQYLSRYIREHTGKNFREIVRMIKLEKAIELLDSTGMSVVKVGEAVGYQSPEHFMRQFKKQYGVSPSNYRNSKAK